VFRACSSFPRDRTHSPTPPATIEAWILLFPPDFCLFFYRRKYIVAVVISFAYQSPHPQSSVRTGNPCALPLMFSDHSPGCTSHLFFVKPGSGLGGNLLHYLSVSAFPPVFWQKHDPSTSRRNEGLPLVPIRVPSNFMDGINMFFCFRPEDFSTCF